MSQTEALVLPVDTRQVKEGEKALDGLTAAGGRAQRATDALRPSFAAFGAAAGAAAGAVALMTKNAIDAADAMNDLHIKTGIAFKSLAAYDLLARQSGTTIQGMAQGIKFLSRYMVEHGDKLKSIGVTSKDTNVAMMQFADVISRIEDPATRTALAMEVLGRSGDELIPSLVNGARGFRDAETATAAYGAALEIAAPMADEFNDLMEVAKTKAKTFGLNMAGEVLPVLISSAKYFSNTSEKVGGFSIAATAAVGTLKALAITVAGIGTAAQIAGVALGGAVAMLGARNRGEVGTIWKAMGDDVAKATAELSTFREELNAGAAATEKAEEGTKKLTAEEEKRIKAMLVGKKEQDDATKKALEWIKAIELQTAQMALTEAQKKSLEAATLALTVKDAALRAEIMRTVAAFTAQANAIEMASVAARENNRIVSEFLDAEEEEQKKVTAGIRGLREKIEAMKEEEFALTATNEQLREHNIQRDLERSGLDKASEAYAEMEKRLRAASDALSIGKEAKKATDEQVRMWERIENVAHDTFVSIFDSGKSAFDRLRDVLKNGLYSLLYQMTVKPFVIQLAASLGGPGIANALGATSSGGGLGMLSNASSLYSAVGGGMSATLGGLIGGEFGAGMAGAYLAPGIAGATTAGATGAMGIGASIGAALPWIGGALAIGGLLGFGRKRQIKPSQLGLMQGQNDRTGAAYQDYLRISQIDVPGGDENLPLYIAYEEKLNAAIKQGLVNKEKLTQIVGQYFTGGANESAESMLQRLDAMLDGLGAGTGAITKATEDQAKEAEKAAEAAQKLADAESALRQTRLDTISFAMSELRNAYEEEARMLEDRAKIFGDFARSIKASTQSLLLGNLSPLTPAQRYAEAARQYEDVSRRTKLGDMDAMGRYEAVRDAFLTASQVFNASGTQYATDFARTLADSDEMISLAERHRDIAADQLDALNSQVSALISIDSGIKSVAEGIRFLAAAQYQSPGLNSGEEAWRDYGIGLTTAGGNAGAIAYLNAAKAAGQTMAQIDARYGWDAGTIEQWAGQRGVASFDVGTDFVPRTGLALIHKGEQIATASQNDETRAILRAILSALEKMSDGQREQAGAIIEATLAAADGAAGKIVAGQMGAAQAGQWRERSMPKAA